MLLNEVKPESMEDGPYEDITEMHVLHRGQYEDDEVTGNTEVDEFGGMPYDLYNEIVEYKRTGNMPIDIKSRQDRSGPSHWRARCAQFTLADDNETLLYYNTKSSMNDQPKVVVKKGEVRKVLQRIHEIIGHLGVKRTQIVCQRKLYWRSTQQDVKTYVAQCEFCNQKKMEGKKIVKAPLDVSSDQFDISISIKDRNSRNGDRLEFSLVGYNEQDVRNIACTRMRSYTFKETTSEYRTRLGSSFRRQPYMKRDRIGQYSGCFMVPLNDRRLKNGENDFIELYEKDGVYYEATADYDGTVIEEEVEAIPQVMDEIIIDSQKDMEEQKVVEEKRLEEDPNEYGREQANVESSPLQLGGVPLSVKRRVGAHGIEINVDDSSRPSTSRFVSNKCEDDFSKKRRLRDRVSVQGIAARFIEAVGEEGEHVRAGEFISSYEHGAIKAEMAGLPAVCLMPSMDPQVAQLQKELLTRQIEVQKLQLKVLQTKYEAQMRYRTDTDIPPEGEEIEVEELNVIDEDEERPYVEEKQFVN